MKRVFTLEEAREAMPKVKSLTRPVFELAASLSEEMEEAEDRGDKRRVDSLRERLDALVTAWSDAVQDLGPEVKGLWLVDFDSGDGYWCWAYPEDDLGYWHSYEGGFGARVPLQEAHRALRKG
ncbi:MAG: hypothetical protein H6Q00_997 [Holophagaceae bacterium]|nr:hypothetical protein [Holophagaceae bacterium]